MTFFNRKKQASFFLLLILVSQISFEKAEAAPIQQTQKTSFTPAKIISPEFAIKPAGSLGDTISRFQYQLIFIGIRPISFLISTAIDIKPNSIISSRVHFSKTFVFNRVLRI